MILRLLNRKKPGNHHSRQHIQDVAAGAVVVVQAVVVQQCFCFAVREVQGVTGRPFVEGDPVAGIPLRLLRDAALRRKRRVDQRLPAVKFQRPQAVFGFQNVISFPCQQDAHAVPDVRVILRDQDRLLCHVPPSPFLLAFVPVYQQRRPVSTKDFLGNLKSRLTSRGFLPPAAGSRCSISRTGAAPAGGTVPALPVQG